MIFSLPVYLTEIKTLFVKLSFHVGSGQQSADAFREPIKNARLLFNHVKKMYNHQMTLLDIGGGYPGEHSDLFNAMALDINKSLDLHFPASNDLKIIAEPGRYFPCTAITLVTNVIVTNTVTTTATFTKKTAEERNRSIESTFLFCFIKIQLRNENIWKP